MMITKHPGLRAPLTVKKRRRRLQGPNPYRESGRLKEQVHVKLNGKFDDRRAAVRALP